MIGAGIEDVVMSCGVEMMSRVPLGSNMKDGSPMGESYSQHYQPTSQFMGAAMIAEEYQITRADTDQFGLESQQKAINAWAEGRFDREVAAIEAPILNEKFEPTGEMRIVDRDEGLRETTLESLAGLNPVPGQEIHTAGSSSQVSDGAVHGRDLGVTLPQHVGIKAKGKDQSHHLSGCRSGHDAERPHSGDP